MLINLHDYEAAAEARMEPGAWAYYSSGVGDEVTLRANREAFARIRIRPRMLVDVSTCDLHTTVQGIPVTMPILIAPTAAHCLAHPEGECATALAAGEAGTLMTASTSATRSLEEIATAATGPFWYQLYVDHPLEDLTDRSFSESLVRRAEAAGYRAIVVTVDAPRFGVKEREERAQFEMPEGLSMANYPGDLETEPASLTWNDIAWLRSLTSLPIILKGILTAEDAVLAVEHGVDGIIVSNHGGRQLDCVPASIEALPEVVAAVNGRCEVYMDGGIRRGTDVLMALALGARAVLIGRPVLWGLAVDGADGVRRVLHLLRDELEQAMALSGCSTLASVGAALVKLP